MYLYAMQMGAACTTMYIIWSRLHGRSHMLSRAILLSPAGFHENVSVTEEIQIKIRDKNTNEWVERSAHIVLVVCYWSHCLSSLKPIAIEN